MHGIAYSYVYVCAILGISMNAREGFFSLFPIRITYSYVEKL